MNPFVIFLLYLLGILTFVAVSLALNAWLGPRPAASRLKQEPFECGATPVESRNLRPIPVKFYAVAVVFLLFDLETIFLVLWALGAQPLTGFMLFTFGLFGGLLLLIVAYIWRSGILEDVTR